MATVITIVNFDRKTFIVQATVDVRKKKVRLHSLKSRVGGKQGILIEREGSVRLASLYQLVQISCFSY